MKLTDVALTSCLALGLMSLACGKGEEASGKDEPSKTPPAAKVDPGPKKAAPPAKKNEPPPEDVYEGNARLINLMMKDGKPVTVDVWATRSFKYAPVKLAEKIAFGEATKWFKSPKGSPVKAFLTGTGPDTKEHLGGMFHPKKGEHITGVIYNDKSGKPTNGNYWETSEDAKKSDTPDAPPAGKGYVIFRAGQLRPHEKAMTEVTGGWALRVGDGKGNCLHQRVEDMGFQASLLGGTQPIEVDLDPGKQKITFHKGMKKGCAEVEKVYELELEVKADTAQLVLLYTPDIKSLKHGVYDMPVNISKPHGTNKKLKEERDAERAKKKAAKEAAK